jgi:iron complex transport system substrate-binding protein
MVKSLVRLGAAFVLAVCLQAAPQRIVSTFPSITETLFAIGAGDRVVGVSDYCRFPPAVLALPKVGGFSKPDPEKIALLRPDLVIIDKYAAALAERLSALKLHYLGVQLGSLADVYTMIHDIGAATGLEQRAEKLNSDIRQSLEAVRARNAKSGSRPSALIVMGRTPGQLTGIIAVGRRTYLGELLEMAGGTNALEDTPIPYPHISLETVVLRNPDVIIDLSLMGKDNDPQIACALDGAP